VFDWNRVGLDGKPRALHISESLASIDFNDFEPRLINSIYSRSQSLAVRYLVDDPLFRVDAFKVKRHEHFHLRNAGLYIIGVLEGRLKAIHGEHELLLKPGQFGLFPA
jgi:mannose-6-phosphate isomerase